MVKIMGGNHTVITEPNFDGYDNIGEILEDISNFTMQENAIPAKEPTHEEIIQSIKHIIQDNDEPKVIPIKPLTADSNNDTITLVMLNGDKLKIPQKYLTQIRALMDSRLGSPKVFENEQYLIAIQNIAYIVKGE